MAGTRKRYSKKAIPQLSKMPSRIGPDLAEVLRHRKPKRGRSWHLNEMRVVVGGDTRWLWRAVNEHGEVLDVVLQEQRDTGAA